MRVDQPLDGSSGGAAGRASRCRRYRGWDCVLRWWPASIRCAAGCATILIHASSSGFRARSRCTTRKLWSGVVAELPSYRRFGRTAEVFSDDAEGSDVLTSYVLAVTSASRPETSRAASKSRCVVGCRVSSKGKIIRDESIQTVDLPMRKLAAIEALARVGKIEAGDARQPDHRARICGPIPRCSIGGASCCARRIDSRSAKAHRGGRTDHSRAAELARHRDAFFERCAPAASGG